MSAPVENLVQRLDARRSGKGWIAKCPAHDDRKPSLSIDEGTDGRALIKCHAGCSTDDVMTYFPPRPHISTATVQQRSKCSTGVRA